MSEGRSGRAGDVLLCALSGVLTFAAFPTAWSPEVNLFFLIWVAHVPLMWVLRDKGPKQAFWWGLLAGTITFGGGYYWIGEMLVTFGGLHWSIAGLGLVLHSVQLGLMWGIWAWVVNRIVNTTSVGVAWVAPLAMVGVELAMPRIFPAYMGNSQYPFTAMMQVCDLFGVHAITFLIYRVNATLYLWLRARAEGRDRPRRIAWVTVAMLGVTLVYGAVRIVQTDARADAAAKLKVGIVEADIGILMTETPEKRNNQLLIHQALSAKLAAEGAELVVWPESSYRVRRPFGDFYLPRNAKRFPPAKAPLVADFRDDFRNRTGKADRHAPIRGFDVPLMFGSTTYKPREKPRWEGDFPITPYNTAWLLDRDGTVAGAYDKVYLLLFGEYVPFVEHFPSVYRKIPTLGNLEPGESLKVVEGDLWEDKGGPIRFGVLICYEGILPGFARGLADQRPHVLVNMTNDDWFGDTAERWLHFVLTIPRAIEFRAPMVRSTLTGISAFIDPVGRVVKTTRVEDPEALSWAVPILGGATVYQVVGDAFAYACLALTLLLFGWGRWRRR